jgi:hypothetical protein
MVRSRAIWRGVSNHETCRPIKPPLQGRVKKPLLPIQFSNSQKDTRSHSRKRDAPKLCVIAVPQEEQEGAGNAGCHDRTRSLVCER